MLKTIYTASVQNPLSDSLPWIIGSGKGLTR